MPATSFLPDSKRLQFTGYAKLFVMQLGLLLAIPGEAQESPVSNICPDTADNLNYWESVYRTRDQDSGNSANADELAIELLPCLASANSTLRDTYGYGLYTYWLRNEALGQSTRQMLFSELLSNLDSEAPLLRSFSALILSELLRSDAIESFLSAEDRDELLRSSSAALIAETDYRGLDAQLGWVHPVAHLADVQWRFALHPQLTPEQARQILQAVANKAVTNQASYIFNEGDRLARVVAIVIRTEILPADEIPDWLEQFASRPDGDGWGSAFNSPEGMAELHNTKAFFRALHNQLQGVEISQSIRESLNQLLQIFGQLV